MMLDALHADRRGDVGLACAGPADQDDLVGLADEIASMDAVVESKSAVHHRQARHHSWLNLGKAR
ncbi:hypothetical protein AJ87_26845 [Rhizobium yanglingense]|nr:hypothetical protein AJ87_26845 [Rhizobium yanglingense]